MNLNPMNGPALAVVVSGRGHKVLMLNSAPTCSDDGNWLSTKLLQVLAILVCAKGWLTLFCISSRTPQDDKQGFMSDRCDLGYP